MLPAYTRDKRKLMAPGALEIAHQKELTRVMRELLDVRRKLYECQGQLATAKADLLKYQTADTLHPPPGKEPDAQ